jgi:hypothetical protein
MSFRGYVYLEEHDGDLRIALLRSNTIYNGLSYGLALEELKKTRASNTPIAALCETLEYYVNNRNWSFVNPDHLGLTKRPALAHNDEYVVDNYGNCVYLGQVYTWDRDDIVDPLEILEREGEVVFTCHRIMFEKPQAWINYKLALYNYIYSYEYQRNITLISTTSVGRMLLELFTDGTSLAFWTTETEPKHFKPDSCFIALQGLSPERSSFIANADITWGMNAQEETKEKYPKMIEEAKSMYKIELMNKAIEELRQSVIETFNAVEEQSLFLP